MNESTMSFGISKQFLITVFTAVTFSIIWSYIIIYWLDHSYSVERSYPLIAWSVIGAIFLSKLVALTAKKFWLGLLKVEFGAYLVLILLTLILLPVSDWEKKNCDQLRYAAAVSGAHMSAFLCPAPISSFLNVVFITILFGPLNPLLFFPIAFCAKLISKS